jgi:PKD repeat protein
VVIDGDGFRWPGGVVPYEIAGDLPNQGRVTGAIAIVEEQTAGVNLVPRNGEANFIRFVTSDGCSSAIGMQGGQQNINLADGCSTGNAAHEILHALGMFHEHTRCDRGDFVVINFDNIEEGKEGNFDIACDGASDIDVYDEGSMMHYGTHAFSANDLPTIESLRGLDHLMGQRDGLGPTDVATINLLYGANNVAPTAVIAALAPSYPEGSPVPFDGSGSTDPDDATLFYSWSFGDGTCSVVSPPAKCSQVSPSHTYADDGAYTVELTVSDGFADGDASTTATIVNVAPAVSAGDDATVDEGSLFSQSGSFTDPGADSWTATVDYGDGGGAVALTLAGKTFELSHTYVDNGVYTVTVEVTDDEGDSGSDQVEVTVLNVPPTVDAGPDAEVTSGETYELSGSFSDPGLADDPWTWEIDWGFGANTTGSTNDQSALIEASRQVCVAGTYTVTLSVTDKDGGTGMDDLTLTVPYFEIDIDISPTEHPNPVSLKNKGLLPVAILSTADFDATEVDPATLVLGNEVAGDTPVAFRNNGTAYTVEEDVNGDGLTDLVAMFRVPALVANGDLWEATTELVLRAFLDDGCTNVRGVDQVTVNP